MRLDEVNWANQLPYDRGDEDADFVREFVAQFKLSALSGSSSALSAILTQLDSYPILPLPLRAHICRILYEFATTQTLDLALFGMCCATLARMLRREDKLTASDMTFDWRKLYDLVRGLLWPKIWQDGPIQQRSKLKSVIDLACEANRFFPASAAMEVFDELLPQIQFNSLDWQIVVIQLLNLFVPTARAPRDTGLVSSGPRSTDVRRWLPTIFSLWSFNLRLSSYDAFFMRFVTCLVVEQKGQLQLTNEQVRFAFASGLHCLNLPVASGAASFPRSVSSTLTDTSLFYRMPLSGSLPLREERALTFARLIVYTLHDESPGGTLDLFGQLVQMIEPFYHPSNNGSWSGILARFLRHLARELLQRSRDEAADDCEVPESARLARHIRRRFIAQVRTLAMLLLFSKGDDMVSMSHSTLKSLAELEPDLIFRPLLDTLYTAIDSVTETHRMISAMRALGKLATTLSNFAHYPEGAQHIAPLLTLTLPGIDVNDPVKSCYALSFVSNICHNGVVFDELAAPGDMPGSRPPSRSPSAAIGDDQDVDEPPELDMAQVEWLTRASTAQFETWIDQYLRRVFALVDNLSSSLDTNNASSAEVGLDAIAAHTTKMVLHQCGEKHYPMITRLVTKFATSITSLSAVNSVRRIVNSFASAIPEQALASLLPLCCEHIAEEIENGVGLAPSLSRVTQSHSETTLIWYVSLLVALTENQDGRHLLRYRDQLLAVMDLLLRQCLSRHVYGMASSLLYNTLLSLTRTSPLNGRSVSDSQWADPEFRENHFRYWGRHPDVTDPSFQVAWHIPSQDEIAFAREIVRRIVQPRIGELDEFIDALAGGGEATDRENVYLNRLLVVLDHGVRALGGLIPPPGERIQPEALVETLVEGDDANGMPPRYRLGQQVPTGCVFTDPGSDEYKEIAGIRDAAGRAAAKTLAHMAKNRADNVENIKCVILLAQHVVCHHGVDRDSFVTYRRAWSYAMDVFSLDNNSSVMPRYIAVRRALFTQISRMFHNTRLMPATDQFRDITSEVARFCLSAYSEVRSYAVAALDSIVSILPAVKYPLIPLFLAELGEREESDPEKMTGALRVLDTQAMRRACLRDWNYFPMMVLALCRAQHEDKPQVKRLIRSTAVTQVVHVAAPLPVQPVRPAIRQLVMDLDSADDAGLDAAVARDRAKAEQAFQFATAENARLINALVDILRDAGTTWRFAAISGYYLDQLVTVRAPPEPRLVDTLAQNLTSDLLLFRESAAVNLAQLLGKIKRRSKTSNPEMAVCGRRISLDMDSAAGKAIRKPGYTDLCERALAGNAEAAAAPYIDNPACGWFAWPRAVKAYAPPPPAGVVAYDQIEPESQSAYEAVRSVLFADGKWDQIGRLFSVEGERPPEEDIFGVSRAALFAQLFSLFDLPLLEQAWPVVERLARENERAGAQRAAAEMIGGLLRGSKHWAQDSLASMWERLVPLLETVFSKLGPDTMRFWQACLHYAFARRDPRRYLPLVRMLVYRNPFNPQSETPFVEAAKLELLRVLISAWDWRIASTIVASRPRLLDALAHPYKQVRDMAGIVMYMLSSAEFSVSYPQAEVAIDDLARHGPTGRDFMHWAGTQRTQALVREMTQRVSGWKAEHVPSNEGTSNYSRGSKTLLTFVLAGFSYSSRRVAVSHISSVLPLSSVLQEQHDDDEVSRLAKTIMQLFAQVLYTTQLSEDVASRILALLTDSSSMWHVITKTLPLLCTLTFANRFTLSREARSRIVDTAAQFLEHEQIEVRQAALSALTSLVKCSSSRVIADMNARFSAKLDAPLPRVRRGRQPADPAAYARMVLNRHAGVLGLSCLVLAFPYTIPDWLPEVLVRLSGCIDDPNPIQSTVQRTFAEFRRTHMDTWHEDRKRFSSCQLEILTDMLVSPCYYA